MATIKAVIREFCFRSNLPAPDAFVGVDSPTEQQYLSLFRQAGDYIRNSPYAWSCLKRGYYFNTQTNVKRYQLPGDFYRLLESSQWDVTNNWPMRGPISDFYAAYRDFAVVSLQTRKGFRVIGPTDYLYSTAPYAKRSAGWFEIDPAGQNNTDQLFLGYISANWIWPRDWAALTVYNVGDIRAGNGNVYICTTAGTSGTTRPSVTSGTETDGTVVWTVYTEPYLVEEDNTKLNDLDRCLFDTDLMIEALKFFYLNSKKLPSDQERYQLDQIIRGAYTRNNGPIRINMADTFITEADWPTIPNGSWNV